MWETITSLVSGASDLVAEAVDTVGSAVSDVGSAVGDAADWAGQQVSDGYNWAGNQLSGTTVKDVATPVWKAIQGGVASLAGTPQAQASSGSGSNSSSGFGLGSFLNKTDVKSPATSKTAVAQATPAPSDPYDTARRMAKATEWM